MIVHRTMSTGWALRSALVIASLVLPACGGSDRPATIADGSIPPPGDGAADVATTDDGGGTAVDAMPMGCSATRLVPGDQTSCRADFRCSGGLTASYVCSKGDGGARCFCIVGSTVASVLDGQAACGQGEETLEKQASTSCGWSVVDSLDAGGSLDGGASIDGGQSFDGRDPLDGDGTVDGGARD